MSGDIFRPEIQIRDNEVFEKSPYDGTFSLKIGYFSTGYLNKGIVTGENGEYLGKISSSFGSLFLDRSDKI